MPNFSLRGELEPIATASWAERVAALVPGARLATVPGTANTYPSGAPAQLSELLPAHLLHDT